jgi:hypothetical protein
MVKFCTKILPTLEEAVRYIREHFIHLDRLSHEGPTGRVIDRKTE